MRRDTVWEHGSRVSFHHLKRRNHENQAGYDRKARSNRDQGEQKHDESERPIVQAVHQPAQREAVSRYLIVQPLQQHGYGNRPSSSVVGLSIGERPCLRLPGTRRALSRIGQSPLRHQRFPIALNIFYIGDAFLKSARPAMSAGRPTGIRSRLVHRQSAPRPSIAGREIRSGAFQSFGGTAPEPMDRLFRTKKVAAAAFPHRYSIRCRRSPQAPRAHQISWCWCKAR